MYYVNSTTNQSVWKVPGAATGDLAVEAPIYVMILPQVTPLHQHKLYIYLLKYVSF